MPYSPQVIKILEDNQRDMRLQAAAPDLLEAARDLLNWKADSDFYKIAEAKLIAAIAKAEGSAE